MTATDINIRLGDDRVIKGRGYEIWIYTFGPILNRWAQPDSSAWAIRHKDTGINIATFTDRSVGLSFLRWLINTYGDISSTLQRCADRQETLEDGEILDAIETRSKHDSRATVEQNGQLVLLKEKQC